MTEPAREVAEDRDVVTRIPGGLSALRTRCTRRSLLVTVPSDSHQAAAAGSTTSRELGGRGQEDVLHDEVVEALEQPRSRASWSASDCAGFSPMHVERP